MVKGSSDYTNPVMLVNRKGPNSMKRVVSDMRFLNSRIRHLNIPFGLVRDAIQTIGELQSTVLSTIDLKEAFHSLRLSSKASEYYSISSYTSGSSYKYLDASKPDLVTSSI